MINEKFIELNGPVDVLVDDHEATIEITHELWSPRVLIKFTTKHEKWGDSFQTKYFEFDEEENLIWGHDREIMKIVKNKND